MKTGPSLGDPSADCGEICMGPNKMLRYQNLVDDAVSKVLRFIQGVISLIKMILYAADHFNPLPYWPMLVKML